MKELLITRAVAQVDIALIVPAVAAVEGTGWPPGLLL